jgi:hypothetical protein
MKKNQPNLSKNDKCVQMEIRFPEMSSHPAVIINIGTSLQQGTAGKKTSKRTKAPGKKAGRPKKRSVVTRTYYKKVKESR